MPAATQTGMDSRNTFNGGSLRVKCSDSAEYTAARPSPTQTSSHGVRRVSCRAAFIFSRSRRQSGAVATGVAGGQVRVQDRKRARGQYSPRPHLQGGLERAAPGLVAPFFGVEG